MVEKVVQRSFCQKHLKFLYLVFLQQNWKKKLKLMKQKFQRLKASLLLTQSMYKQLKISKKLLKKILNLKLLMQEWNTKLQVQKMILHGFLVMFLQKILKNSRLLVLQISGLLPARMLSLKTLKFQQNLRIISL